MLDWTRTGELSYRVEVPAGSDPFWLVLGQSLSAGWSAKVAGGPSLGAPTLIDGFANGWWVQPDGAPMTIEIAWTPQRTVWIALLVSGLWFLLLLGAAIASLWVRRRRADDVGTPAECMSLARSVRPPLMTSLWTVGGLGLLGAALGGTGVAIATMAITAVALRSRRHTLVTTIAAVGSIAMVVTLYVGLQWRRHYPMGVEWPSGFLIAHQLALVAVLSVVVELVVRFLVRTKSQIANDASQSNDGSTLTR